MEELIRSPIFGTALTVAVFVAASLLYARLRTPLVNPVLVSVVFLVLLLKLTGISYEDYNRGGSVVSFFLGPAVVALAVPLFRHRELVLRRLLPIGSGVLAGALTSIFVTVLVARALGASEAIVLSLAPRSVTTPIALGIAEEIGAVPSLAATVVILTGVFGAVAGPAILSLARVREPVARGLAMGTSSHGIGTARALEEGSLVGAVAGLAIGLHGLVAVWLIPLLLPFLM